MLQIFILAGIGVIAMLSEVLNFKKWMPIIAKFGVVLAISASLIHWNDNAVWFNNMMADDSIGKAFILITSVVFLLWLIISDDLFAEESSISDIVALACFSMVGGYMMVSFYNLAMLFLGIEILSIPVYVLAGANRKSLKSNESAFKYFLMGAFASGILLFGMTFLYGSVGSFDVIQIGEAYKTGSIANPIFFKGGILLIVFALLFKVSAVPFHFWTADVYEGAPNKVTAYMATIVKAFAAAAAFRLFFLIFGEVNENLIGVAGLCALTMIVGNVLGAVQDNPKRMLAYSSIGHAGFMLIPVVMSNANGASTLIYYVTAYSLASLLAFFILHKVLVKDDFYWSIGDFNGLSKRNGLLAVGMAVALLSMAGIPPLSGFFAKYFIFSQAFKEDFSWLVLFGIIASLIGVYYYSKVIISMYLRGRDDDMTPFIELTLVERVIIIVLMAGIVITGIFPDAILGLV